MKNKASTINSPAALCYGIPKIAEFLELEESTVRNLIREGQIPAFKLGTGRTCPLVAKKSSLLAWLDQCEAAAEKSRPKGP